MEKISISVIIRTKNSKKTLERCLQCLKNQSVQVTEILVVDSGSTDNTLDIARKCDCKIVYYPSEEAFNYSKAINIGIKAAKGKYILILSSHVFMEHVQSLEFMYTFLVENAIFCAVTTLAKVDSIKEKKIANFKDVEWKVSTFLSLSRLMISNACALIRRKDWKAYPFNENMPTAEDQEWAKYQMETNNFAAVQIFNPYIVYANPYINMWKEHMEFITIGKHVYPYLLSYKYALALVSVHSIKALLEGKLKHIRWNYVLAFRILKERLGFKATITSSYNKKLD